MKKLAIIRFGSHAPLESEREIYRTAISSDGLDTLFFPVSFGNIGMLSLIYTKLSAKELTKLFVKASEDAINEPLPIIVFELNSENCSMYLDHIPNLRGVFIQFNKNVSDYNAKHVLDQIEAKPINSLSLDDLLDLVSKRGGLKNLNEAEKKRLSELSRE